MNRFIAILIALIASLGLNPITAKVINLDQANDTVTVQMGNGHIFAFFGCEDYCIGDYVSAILWNNGTPDDCRDDVIVSVHYAGYADYAGDNLD